MDLSRLRRLVAEVDDEHREAMRTLADDVDRVLGAPGANRRSFLRCGMLVTAGAVTLAVGPLAGSAAAADATTTTAPPQRPTTDDYGLLAFAQSVELAAAQIYREAVASSRLTDTVKAVATLFGSHHTQHAAVLAGFAGKSATGTANAAWLGKLGSRRTPSNTEADWLTLALDAETAAAATYTALLGEIVGTDPAAAVASIQPIEARHATVLGQVLQRPLSDIAIAFEPSTKNDGALLPADYPIEG